MPMGTGTIGQRSGCAWTFLWLCATVGCLLHMEAMAQQPCMAAIGRVVSLEGSVTLKRPSDTRWVPLTRLNLPLCSGDLLHVGKLGRAAVLLAPRTVIRLDQITTLQITVDAAGVQAELFQDERVAPDQVGKVCGAAHVITRIPRSFRLKSPYLNASVEGTEFQMAFACDSSTLDVFEGRVAASVANAANSVLLTSGQTTAAGAKGELAPIKTIVQPVDAVQWALYYPPLSERLDTGDDCDALAAAQQAACRFARGEALLRVGRVDEARDALAPLREGVSPSADVSALDAIIAVVKNDFEGALRLSQRAIDASPTSSRAWMARSYALQARFQLQAALSAVRSARALDPTSALAHAREAELLMALGRRREASTAAGTAVAANSADPHAHTVLGFTQLINLELDAAIESFNRAIELDSSDPRPRLGLGVANIRRGALARGREEIDIAVALDPRNALIRAYAGKAYYEENRGELDVIVQTQFDQARTFDPKDPTPDYYEAILEQSRNRPIDALGHLAASIAKNDYRAVHRSRLLLDEDQAARRTSLAKLYQDAGFSQLAVSEAYRSLEHDPGNFAAHRHLSDAFGTLPRHEIAQTSELLQSTLRAPLLLDPVPPYRNAPNLFIPRASGPVTPSDQELNPLFVSSGLSAALEGVLGSLDTHGGSVAVALLGDRVAVRGGMFRYDAEGFRPNNDLFREISNLFAQVSLTPDWMAQAEWMKSDFDFGDLALRFDPTFVRLERRNIESQETVRIGSRYVFDPRADVVMSVILNDFDSEARESGVSLENDITSVQYEGQSRIRSGPIGVTVGAGHIRDRFIETFIFPGPLDIRRQTYGYLYGDFEGGGVLSSLQFGLTTDRFISESISRASVNPKFGIILRPGGDTAVRATYLRALSRSLLSSQTIEPTQVAGFNKLYNDLDGSVIRQWGIAVEHTLNSTTHGGLEWVGRKLIAPVIDFNTSLSIDVTRQERQLRAYLYHSPNKRMTLTLDGYYERLNRQLEDASDEEIIHVRTWRIPLGINYFTTSGLTFRAAWTHWRQRGDFLLSDPNTRQVISDKERFSVVDAQIQWRLPRRKGYISLGANNLFDAEHRFQETDQFTPRYLPKRFVYVRANLLF